MPELPSQPVSVLLGQWGAGDQEALQVLIPLVYEELRRIARRNLRQERPDREWATARAWLLREMSRKEARA